MVWTPRSVGVCRGFYRPCSTPYGINGLDTLGKGIMTGPLIGAQRLTASMVWTLLIFSGSCRWQPVLNALRHQWFGHRHHHHHPKKGTHPVLNALRHQWFGHNWIEAILFGEIDVLNALRHQWFGHRTKGVGRKSRPRVLNALRHQWFGHKGFGVCRCFT